MCIRDSRKTDGVKSNDINDVVYRVGHTGFNENNPTREVDIMGTMSVLDANDNSYIEGGNATGTGDRNVSIGFNNSPLFTTARLNTSVGSNQLQLLTTGIGNTAVGHGSLQFAVPGALYNTGIGYRALQVVSGDRNVGIGRNAAVDVTTGSDNVAISSNALFENTAGSNNIAILSLIHI